MAVRPEKALVDSSPTWVELNASRVLAPTPATWVEVTPFSWVALRVVAPARVARLVVLRPPTWAAVIEPS